jgi:hypothetical protein
MIVTLELVEIIFLGWLQPKKFYVWFIFRPPYSKIASRTLKNSHPIKYFKGKHIPTQLHFILLSLSSPFPNGASILCNVSLPQRGHSYIIISIDYFTKWVEAIPTFLNDGCTIVPFVFNHIITQFNVPQGNLIDHGSNFQNQMMGELRTKLCLLHDNSSVMTLYLLI